MGRTAAERRYAKIETEAMRDVFEAAGNRVTRIVEKAIRNRSTQTSYWMERQEEVDSVLEKMSVYWRGYTSRMIPESYSSGATVIEKAFKDLKTRDLYPGSLQRGAVQALMQQTVNDMEKAINNGSARVADLFRLTQQTAITEENINKKLAEGLISEGTPQALKNDLRTAIEDAIGEGKVLVVNGKNGPIAYQADTYAELVARTRSREAQSIGAVNTMKEYGMDKIQFSSHGSDTPICIESGGESDDVFSLSGNGAPMPPNGLPPWHPNCQHVVVPYTDDMPEPVEAGQADRSEE